MPWLGMALSCLLLFVLMDTAHADGLEPEWSLLPTSAKSAFVMDAYLPKDYWGALDDRNYLAITGLYVGDRSVAAGAESLLTLPGSVCSIYDNAICHDVSGFYKAAMPQILLSGYYKLDGNNAITWGIDTGFSSQKLSVSPAIMLGISKRWYLSEKRDAQFVFELSGWLGQSVNHTPCYDSFNRAYYCGNLSAWSDFSAPSHANNIYLKVWYDWAF